MKYLLYLVIAIVIAGCSVSRITSSWKKPDASAKSYKKILVLGIVGEPDRTLREQMEEHLAGDLRALGYNAVSSIKQYNPKEFEGMTEKQAIQSLQDDGFDGVVTIVLLNKEKERYYTPSKAYYSPYATHQGRFYSYYSTMYGRVYTPGYYSEETKYFWESNLYDLGDWQLVYSAQSQSFEPESAKQLAHEYGLMIVNDMVKQGMLQKQTPALKSF